ncbi:MAG: YggT family protein [Anaerolineae bacterium]
MEEFRDQIVTTTTEEAPQTVIAATTTTESFEPVSVDAAAPRRLILYRTRQAIGVILAFVEGLIAIRFILRLFGANPDAGFAQFIYGLTAPLVAPFAGLFGTPLFGGSAFEFTSLVAMLIYVLLAWVIVKLILMFFSGARIGRMTRRTDIRIP